MKYEAEARLREDKEVHGDAVYDGDTFKMLIRPWIGQQNRETVRLLGIDTAELYGMSHDLAVEQKEFVERWFSEAGGADFPVIIEAQGEDSFGRTLAKIQRKDTGESLSDAIIEKYGEKYRYDG